MNPFTNISVFVQDEEMYQKIFDASIMWDVLTDGGDNANDEKLMTVLLTNDLDFLWYDYLIYKNGNDFDMDGLKEALEIWAMSN